MSKDLSAAAAELARKGGRVKNPNKGMGSATPEERKERSRKMHEARWGKKQDKQEPESDGA